MRTSKYSVALTSSLLFFFVTTQAQQSVENAASAALPQPAGTQVDFQREIEPLLKQKCNNCHGPRQQMNGLRLDSRAAALQGGYSGPAVKPGDSAGSRLVHMVAGIGIEKNLIMPMGGERLTSAQVGLLRAWIDQGLEWPETDPAANQARSAETKHPMSEHWAFNPPVRPSLPTVNSETWVKNPIDRFVPAKLEAEGIAPSPEADRPTLIRRVSFDLIGLPPTPQEVDSFLGDQSPQAYERLVDRLLDSPHYGEKWARHWLDLARYADSDGYEKDMVRPHAWRWRDWVIKALNSNMPFDQFTIEQIAGDLLPNATMEQRIATGFHRNTLTNREGGIDLEEYRVEQVIDRVSTVGTAWLGLTLGCARCHDHKYDPLTQKEFYQLTAFFNTSVERNIEVPLPHELGSYLQTKAEYDRKRRELLWAYKVAEIQQWWEKKTLWAADHEGMDPIYDISWDNLGNLMFDGGQDVIRTHPAYRTGKYRDLLTDHFVRFSLEPFGEKRYSELKFKELTAKLRKLKREYPRLTEAPIIVENPSPPKSHVLIRGDFRRPGIEVQPGTPAVLNPMPADPAPSRLTLARWLVSKDNPLTARVTVNRLWQEYFGRGLVEPSVDFGTRSEPPTHPELLDWLATAFMDSGWDVKATHKLIVMSSVYRQSSNTRAALLSRDPDNRLLARQARLRLSAELVRDNALAVSGLLNRAVGGKSVRPPQPPGVLELAFGDNSEKWIESKGRDRYRRGLYIQFLRTAPYPQLLTFDAPNSLETCSVRERSTTPLQALNLLNDPVFFEAAQVFAARILREQTGTVGERVAYAYRLALGRSPTPEEEDRLLAFYEEQKALLRGDRDAIETLFPAADLEGVERSEAAAWVTVGRLLLNLDEFITRG